MPCLKGRLKRQRPRRQRIDDAEHDMTFIHRKVCRELRNEVTQDNCMTQWVRILSLFFFRFAIFFFFFSRAREGWRSVCLGWESYTLTWEFGVFIWLFVSTE
jgi:hypothetical protein